MAKRYMTLAADGSLAITAIVGLDADGSKLTKVLFELSRTSDMTTHFDPAVHTREVIAAGISGHRALALTAECEDSDLPSDQYFRDAWEWDGSAVAVNMTKARAIHLTEIRRVRDEELVKLDIPWMKAVEAGDTDAQATIKGQKETLRDLPATFDITTDVDTPEKLKAKWPSELPARE